MWFCRDLWTDAAKGGMAESQKGMGSREGEDYEARAAARNRKRSWFGGEEPVITREEKEFVKRQVKERREREKREEVELEELERKREENAKNGKLVKRQDPPAAAAAAPPPPAAAPVVPPPAPAAPPPAVAPVVPPPAPAAAKAPVAPVIAAPPPPAPAVKAAAPPPPPPAAAVVKAEEKEVVVDSDEDEEVKAAEAAPPVVVKPVVVEEPVAVPAAAAPEDDAKAGGPVFPNKNKASDDDHDANAGTNVDAMSESDDSDAPPPLEAESLPVAQAIEFLIPNSAFKPARIIVNPRCVTTYGGVSHTQLALDLFGPADERYDLEAAIPYTGGQKDDEGQYTLSEWLGPPDSFVCQEMRTTGGRVAPKSQRRVGFLVQNVSFDRVEDALGRSFFADRWLRS